MNVDRLEEIAHTIFGTKDPESVREWVRYWMESAQRNRDLLRPFEQLALLDFTGKRVLDIGCGTGGMGQVIGGRCGFYVGADYKAHVLQLAVPARGRALVQCSGTDLPFLDRSFDVVIAFDVVEHLTGGFSWQVSFLKELRRILKPLGMILLTTPNWWAPYDGHTRLYFPQYLPTWLADRYISWKRPSFLREHSSFAQIRLMSPRQLRKGLALSGLRFLHDLPCGLDRPEYLRHFPLRGVLAYLGFGWYPHAEFWGAAVRRESVPAARLKLRKNWYYEQRQPSPEGPTAFRSSIDFDLGFFNPQLGPGWYWHERERGRGFRWIGHKATCYLETHFDANYVSVRGFSPERNRLQVHVNGLLVGEHDLEKEEDFRLRYLLPFRRTAETIQRVELSCSTTFRPERSDDDRELGTMIFSLGLDR